MNLRRVVVPAILIGFARVNIHAQTPTISAVQVRVRDSTGVAVSGAEVAVMRGLADVLGAGTTDAKGAVTIRIAARAGDDVQLVARKFGYGRGDEFVHLVRDSVTVDIPLRRSVQSLAPVVVNADHDIKRKAYHIDADEIANSDRLIVDATDILAKLRPDMICGRSCDPLESVAAQTRNPVRKCPTLAFSPVRACPVDSTPPSLETNVWVNGRRIRLVPLDEVALARQHGLLAGLKPGTMTVLSEIKPEHIAEMTYADEFDNTVGKNGSNDALFIVLKPGIGYDAGRPSYVIASSSNAATRDAGADTASLRAAITAEAPAPFRYRLLGVYDESSGDPIVGASVVDARTGSFVKTSTTGTVSLIFLDEGTNTVRIQMPGYDELRLDVEISPTALQPLTLVMHRHASPE